MRLFQLQSVLEHQTASLFLLDGLANVIDFAFHFWMGRVLIPADFAVLQTLNSVALVYVTASGVFQPVVSRFVAEARGRKTIPSLRYFKPFCAPPSGSGWFLQFLFFCYPT